MVATDYKARLAAWQRARDNNKKAYEVIEQLFEDARDLTEELDGTFDTLATGIRGLKGSAEANYKKFCETIDKLVPLEERLEAAKAAQAGAGEIKALEDQIKPLDDLMYRQHKDWYKNNEDSTGKDNIEGHKRAEALLKI